jgi:hypothetical protein
MASRAYLATLVAGMRAGKSETGTSPRAIKFANVLGGHLLPPTVARP